MKAVNPLKSQLLEQLRQFGLDARDWILVKQNDRDYLIRSKSQKDLAFKGRTHQSGRSLHWDFIDLYSL